MKKFLSFVCFLSLSAALLAGCTLVSRDPSVSQEPSGPEGASVSQSVQMEAAEVNVMALNGPTSMGMVQFMTENDARTEKKGRYNFTITSMTDEVSAALAQGTTDIAAIPANLASILYHNTNGSSNKRLRQHGNGILLGRQRSQAFCRFAFPLDYHIANRINPILT